MRELAVQDMRNVAGGGWVVFCYFEAIGFIIGAMGACCTPPDNPDLATFLPNLLTKGAIGAGTILPLTLPFIFIEEEFNGKGLGA